MKLGQGDQVILRATRGTCMSCRAKRLVHKELDYLGPSIANKPGMSIIQDTLRVIRMLTLIHCFLDWAFVQNILIWVPHWGCTIPTPAIIEPKPRWTVKHIPSMTIPHGINLELGKGKPCLRRRSDWERRDGIRHCGHKKTVGAAAAAGLMIINPWLFHNAVSIGIGDTMADSKTMEYITKAISGAKSKAAGVIDGATMDRLKT
ncbi:hypothetical protein BKA70DRAFT_1431010 [Coprinopsis sp. MPI-PUGE-AT-0042]|nr:hypothetical protein BKA70DRAFT_1431010 [Coprinopsis sp. MPI-PUGE-AT-0042]